ncbi:hypothetical protein [Microtetraspora fusca]|uniref:hypothetical protein n=1 Tax=Microtetraspora fusca TaxID=1997 RepID=UPI0012FB88CF|nr:hypothetical protein [Microtetraspora fusca]
MELAPSPQYGGGPPAVPRVAGVTAIRDKPGRSPPMVGAGGHADRVALQDEGAW